MSDTPHMQNCARCGDNDVRLEVVGFKYRPIGVGYCRCGNVVSAPVWGTEYQAFKPVIELWNKQHEQEGTPA